MREALSLMVFLLSAWPAAGASIAVVPFGDTARGIADEVRSAAAKIEDVAVQPGSATTADVSAAGESGVVCGAASDDCLVRLALFTHADRLISIGASNSERGLEVEMIVIDTALGRRTGTVSATIPLGDGRAAAIEQATVELLAPHKVFGSLVVSSNPVEAVLSVDGSSAIEPNVPIRLRAGAHSVEARLAGHRPFRASIDVPAGVETRFMATLEALPKSAPPLEPNDGPPLSSVGVVTAIAGGGLLVAAGGTAVIIDAVLFNTGAGEFESREAATVVGRVAIVVAAVGAAATLGGVGLVLVDGAGENPASAR